jgi:FAD:protein FMN transferase
MNHPVLTEFSRRAMATEFAVMLPGMIGKDAEFAVKALSDVESIENQLSIYVGASDVSRLNSSAGLASVKLGPIALEVIARANQISRWTDGAFDITAGPLVEAWGFTKRRGQKPAAEVVAEAKSRVGFQNLRVDTVERTAELRLPGMSVNLGAIGKGYALDHVAKKLRAAGINDFLLHGGRSSVLASGVDIPGDDEGSYSQGWKVAVEHPLVPGRRLGGILMRNESLGTSGSGKQFFHHQGRRFGHVIDPRTGWPAGDMLSVTVITASAMDADALATALFVMGWEAAAEFVNRHNHSLESSQPASENVLHVANENAVFDAGRLAIVAVLPTDRQADVEVRLTGFKGEAWIPE